MKTNVLEPKTFEEIFRKNGLATFKSINNGQTIMVLRLFDRPSAQVEFLVLMMLNAYVVITFWALQDYFLKYIASKMAISGLMIFFPYAVIIFWVSQ
jgi:hypothetical protein